MDRALYDLRHAPNFYEIDTLKTITRHISWNVNKDTEMSDGRTEEMKEEKK